MKTIRFLLGFILILGLTGMVQAGNGPGGPGGGGGDIPDTGELYGDLYVILRDINGVPILSADGCIQPISAVTDSTTITTSTGDVTIEVSEGEPFALPTYTDVAGDLVECELTEDMSGWVQAVDFGRLNLGRAPEGVIAHAFDEAIKKLNAASDLGIDPAGRIMYLVDDTWSTIDAPAENLALYIEMMKNGDWVLTITDSIVKGGRPEGKGPSGEDGSSSELRPVLNESASALLSSLGFENLGNDDNDMVLYPPEFTLAASLLAAAADKTGSITLDKVVYINSIYGINQAGSLPGNAEGETFYDFSAYGYNRDATYADRGSAECAYKGTSWVWVLQPEADTDGNPDTLHFVTTCMNLLGYEEDPTTNSVRFTDMDESYTTVQDSNGDPLEYAFDTNVRAFTQAADDALQVIEYIHNYKIPEVLYP